ncbi:MAG: shikimate dehydrogenase [Paracoccaceae bacterium]|nr:shikimate dehydrogenase [Paracoccaceae bacterium]
MPQITGRTKFLAHLGVPTESFKAPMIYNPFFEDRGIDAVVVPMGCEAGDLAVTLPALFRMRNIAGALITMPHKVSVVDLLDEVSITVKVCGSCNAVKRNADGRLIGDMFDGVGFVRGMLNKGRTAKGASALVVGSGGVGSAIAASLAGAGVGKLALYDARPESANLLANKLKAAYPSLTLETGSNDPTGFDIIVNATPIGMNPGDPLPMDTNRIAPSAFVGEVVMKSEETPFLAAARKIGCQTQIGTDMLFEQIPAYLEFFGFPTTSAAELQRLARIEY